MKYKTVLQVLKDVSDREKFDQEINDLLKKGWVICGPLNYGAETDTSYGTFVQALVKLEKGERLSDKVSLVANQRLEGIE